MNITLTKLVNEYNLNKNERELDLIDQYFSILSKIFKDINSKQELVLNERLKEFN